PLRVDRFIGRMVDSDGINPPSDVYNGSGSLDVNVADGALLCRMQEGNGRFAVRDATPFSHLFQGLDRSWEVKSVLPPKSFYKLYLRATGIDAIAGGLNAYYPCISMVGMREVKVI